ncbi:hypothetical protein [Catenovulum maritimum]|uniref:hypothetical protein n=1 Tax=Catenovulum maritimum TaxID=1513271 RepID=UPI000660084E|nr:hypothetical protein [Catenovulum maritimum]
MSTKEWITSYRDGPNLYQECFYDFENHEVNPNPVVIQIEYPKNYHITSQGLVDGKPFSQLTVEISAERFDQIAIAWCKTRNLNTEKYTLNELLDKCNFSWPISEKELIIGFNKVSELTEFESKQVELAFDNIFDAITEDKDEALQLKIDSDELIKQRDASELDKVAKEREYKSKIKGAAKGILSHINANQSIDDEESMVSVIEQALTDILRK